jgi:hypothetical protein
MATIALGGELIPHLDRLTEVLDEQDPVTQQKLIEVLAVRHLICADRKHRQFVLDSMVKHIRQLLASVRED